MPSYLDADPWRVDAAVLQAAAVAASQLLPREKDGSFLESTLEAALIDALPDGASKGKRPELRLWQPNLGRFDIEVSHASHRAALELKVWDATDSVFDLLKLAAGTQHRRIDVGYLVVAARPNDWLGILGRLSAQIDAGPVLTSADELLQEEGTRLRRKWVSWPAKPRAIPALIETEALANLRVLQVPDHALRVMRVEAANSNAHPVTDDGRLGPVDHWDVIDSR